MNGDWIGFSQVKIRGILTTEFLIPENTLEQRGIEHAAEALEIYNSVEEFLVKTGWGRDNPECSSEKYLTENRVCRWVDGSFLYFSRLIWENMENRGRGEIHI